MNIIIHGRQFNTSVAPHVQHIFTELDRRGLAYQIYDQFSLFLNTIGVKHKPAAFYSTWQDMWQADIVFSIGGDGTMLDTVSFVREKQYPIFGINAGRLGFLANTSSQEVRWALEEVFQGNFALEERTLLKLNSSTSLFEAPFALNEFSILKRDSSSMVLVHAFVDGEYLNAYWADGLLVSTPTGSTGYNLSVGGPLVMPNTKVFIISPVSPHHLNVRPIIVQEGSTLSFEVESRSNSFLVSLDSRSVQVENGVKLSLEKEKFYAKFIRLSGGTFIRTLRNKFNWGFDVRN